MSCNIAGMENDLEWPDGRLRWARARAGYKDAKSFAKAVGVKEVTYRAYEAGQNGFAKHAAAFAEKLEVSPAWLLFGVGTPEGLPQYPLPNASVLTTVFASLLDSLEIEPWEGGRARKLAESFPDALQSIEALRKRIASDPSAPPAASSPDGDEDPKAP